jgi:glycosyltransferase involved in cell wall biosynthesis
MECKVSVIVPVYNVEKYLNQCIDSIITQTLDSFELILIDDGSPDNSGMICDSYALIDNRIRVIHKENGGLASACLCGVEQAKGEYIIFVDSDDWIDIDMFKTLYDAATLNDAQMVLCHALREFKNKFVYKKMHLLENKKYSKTDIINYVFPSLISNGFRVQKSISNSRCAKLFDTNLLKSNLKYYRTDVINGEDLQLTFSCILDAESIFCINDYYPYHYRVNEESITRTYNSSFLENSIKLYNHLNYISKEKGIYDFSYQFNIWFANRILVSIDQELKLHRVSSKKEIIIKIKEICSNPITRQFLQNADLRKFSIHDKFLLKLVLFGFVSSIYNILASKEYVKKMKVIRISLFKKNKT